VKISSINADRPMLVFFWGVKTIIKVDRLPKAARINATSFRDVVLAFICQKLQEHASHGCKQCTLAENGNAKVRTATVVSAVMPDLRLKGMHEPSSSPNICASDFVLLSWLNGKLSWRQLT
jgi:hypothetical protein